MIFFNVCAKLIISRKKVRKFYFNVPDILYKEKIIGYYTWIELNQSMQLYHLYRLIDNYETRLSDYRDDHSRPRVIHLTRETNFILGARSWHPLAQRYSVLALFRDEAPWMRVDGRFQMQTKHFAAGLINVNRHPIVMEVHWKVLHGPACPLSAHEKPPGTWPWAAVVHRPFQTTRFTRCVHTDNPQNLTIFSLLFITIFGLHAIYLSFPFSVHER